MVKCLDVISVSTQLPLDTIAGSNINNGELGGWGKIGYLEYLVRVSFEYLNAFDSHGVSLVLSVAHDSEPSLVVNLTNVYVLFLKDIRRGDNPL